MTGDRGQHTRGRWKLGTAWGLAGVGALCLLCPLAQAQEGKIGYVKLGKVFEEYQRTKASEADLQKRGKQKDAELQSRREELKKLTEGLELLSDAARETKGREVEQKADELERVRKAALRDFRREREKVAGDIFKDIRQAIEAYGKANGFAMIIKAEDTLLFGEEAYDVTDKILQELNGRYGAKR